MSRIVLVAETRNADRAALTTALESVGLQTIPCGTAAAVREALADTRVAAVVLDADLIEGEGVTLLRDLRATPGDRRLPVVVLSSGDGLGTGGRDLPVRVDEHVRRPYDSNQLAARVARLAGAVLPGGEVTILVIEDSPTFRLLLTLALAEAGYTVIEAATGEEGLQLAGARRPDAIVVDGVLPGIDGATVIRHLRLDVALRDVPCLLLTSSGERDAELRAFEAGADAFARKQDEMAVALARIAAMIRRAPGWGRPADATPSLSGLRRILLAAGSQPALQWLADALTRDGYEVVAARSGQEALEALAAQPVDCILLHLLTPGMNGQETCARIKTVPVFRDIPLILLAAAPDQRVTLAALAAGADDCLDTSSESAVVVARVRAQIRRNQVERENRRVREALLRRELDAVEARAARELAETRAQLVEELERKNRELEAFSYSVSHDLRAPLRAIDGFSQLVLEDYSGGLPREGQALLQRVCAAARRMGNLIDALLELSRVGRAPLRVHRVDLSAMAREIVLDLQGQSPRQVDVVVHDGLVVEADARLLRVVLENLLGNSWKFTGTAREPCIEFGSERHDDEGLVYVVRDNGAGFDMAYAEKLFRPFQRLHSDAEFAGTGIGLATVHRIVDRHGGRVWAEGRVGQGATFRFTLPPVQRGGLA